MGNTDLPPALCPIHPCALLSVLFPDAYFLSLAGFFDNPFTSFRTRLRTSAQEMLFPSFYTHH